MASDLASAAEGLAEYVMPSLGADMDNGTVIEWNVAVGDLVSRGDIVARVETEKSDIDIEIWLDGVVREILVRPGRLVAVGTPLLLIDEDVTSGAGAGVASRPSAEAANGTPATPLQMRSGSDPERIHKPIATPSMTRPVSDPGRVSWASPLARSLAAERGIDIAALAGTGPHGAVVAADVLGAPAPAEAAAPETEVPSDLDVAPSRGERMRRMIASRMSRANAEIPHYFLERDVDVTPLLDQLTEFNAELEISDRIVPAAAFVRAVALAAARHGELNGHWREDGFEAADEVNVSVAISLRTGGLVTPQIPRADEKSLTEMMAALREITTAARSGVQRSDSVGSVSTITVTNLGDRGADLVHGVISPPEVALVGFGRIMERPWVVDGAVVPRHVVTVTLAADHRATDGATGSRFLATIAKHLEHALEHPAEHPSEDSESS